MTAGLALVFSGCALITPPGEEPTPEPPAPGWSVGADLFDPLQEQSVVAWQAEVVIIGGFDGVAAVVDRVEAYDPLSDSWRLLPDLPVPLHHALAVVHDGSLFVLGGNTGFDFAPWGAGYVLEPDATDWAPATTMPVGAERGAAVVGVLAGRVHVVGGLGVDGVTDEHHAWDPSTDAWVELAPLPEPTDHAAGGVIDGRLVVAGGRSGPIGSHRPDTWIYDPDADAWSEGPAMPTGRGGAAGAVLGGSLYVFGGEGNPDDESGVFPQAEVWDVAAEAWSALGPMPTPIHGTGATAIDGQIWIPGGAPNESFGPPIVINQAWRPE